MSTNRNPARRHKPQSNNNGQQQSPKMSIKVRLEQLKKRRVKEREDAIANHLMADPDVPRSLSEAITLIGTCQDMCPQYERVLRIDQGDVWKLENKPLSANNKNNRDFQVDEARMVKKFRRPAAGIEEQIPSDLRPPKILDKTLNYLVDEILGKAEDVKEVHNFLWDRTRSIRNDFSVQQLRDTPQLRIAIDCFERIVRFHILTRHLVGGTVPADADGYNHHQDLEQGIKTLVSLMAYYDSVRDRYRAPNEAEFRAYWIITQIPIKNEAILEEKIQHWPRYILGHPKVELARRLYSTACNTQSSRTFTQTIAQQDFMHFWRLLKSPATSYLTACTAEIFFDLIRKPALFMIIHAYSRGRGRSVVDWSIEDLLEPLGFDDEDEAMEYIEAHGLSVKEGDNKWYLDISDATGITFDQLEGYRPPRIQYFSSGLVEFKRFGRTNPAVVNGLNVKQARAKNQITEDYSQSQTTKVIEKDESMFVPADDNDEEIRPSDQHQDSHLRSGAFLGSSFLSNGKLPATNGSTTTNLGRSLFDRVDKPASDENISTFKSPFTIDSVTPTSQTSSFMIPLNPQASSNLFSGINTTTQSSADTFGTSNPSQNSISPKFSENGSISKPEVHFDPTVPSFTPTKPIPSSSSNALSNPATSFDKQASTFANTTSSTPPLFSFAKPVSTKSTPSEMLTPKFNFPSSNQTSPLFQSPSPGTVNTDKQGPGPSFASSAVESPLTHSTPPQSSTFTSTSPILPQFQTSSSYQPLQFGPSEKEQKKIGHQISPQISQKSHTISDFQKPSVQSSLDQTSLTTNTSDLFTTQAQVQSKMSNQARRKELSLDYLAQSLFLDKTKGLLKFYIEHVSTPIYDDAKLTYDADCFRAQKLMVHYFTQWRHITILKKKKRKAFERRARLANETAKKVLTRSREGQVGRKSYDYHTEMTKYDEIVNRAENHLRSSGSSLDSRLNKSKSYENFRKSENDIIHQSTYDKRKDIPSDESPLHSHGLHTQSDIVSVDMNGTEESPPPLTKDEILRKQFLKGGPLHNVHEGGKINSLQSEYFRLKSLGLQHLTADAMKRQKRFNLILEENQYGRSRSGSVESLQPNIHALSRNMPSQEFQSQYLRPGSNLGRSSRSQYTHGQLVQDRPSTANSTTSTTTSLIGHGRRRRREIDDEYDQDEDLIKRARAAMQRLDGDVESYREQKLRAVDWHQSPSMTPESNRPSKTAWRQSFQSTKNTNSDDVFTSPYPAGLSRSNEYKHTPQINQSFLATSNGVSSGQGNKDQVDLINQRQGIFGVFKGKEPIYHNPHSKKVSEDDKEIYLID